MALRDRYEWLIGTRYLRSGQRRGFLSFISVISVVGLALGVAVLRRGDVGDERLRDANCARASCSVTSHATLMGLEGPLPDWRARAAARAHHAGRAVGGAVHRVARHAGGRRAPGRRAVARH